jgi:Carboxypeptidase regulatory-like domain
MGWEFGRAVGLAAAGEAGSKLTRDAEGSGQIREGDAQALSVTNMSWQIRRVRRFGVVWVLMALAGMVSAAVPLPAQQAPAEPPPSAQAVQQAERPPVQETVQQSDPQATGSISGTVVDLTGAIIVGAKVRLTRGDKSAGQERLTDDQGQYSFANVAPGPFELTISFTDLATQVISGTVKPGEANVVPRVEMVVATQSTQVTVSLTQVELAEVQVKEQEKQRILGIIPNFYVTYLPNAVPLSPKQKFELAWRSSVDPFTFVAVGAIAGIQQAGDGLSGYGQGAQGYAKRYGASYADVVIGTFIGSAALPALWKQDPRYFYKGTGSKKSRTLYALASPFICKGDNGKWQPNYSYVVGNFAAAGIANFYYPASDRGAWLVAETALVRLGENAIASVFQEFIVRKLTPRVSNRAQPQQ